MTAKQLHKQLGTLIEEHGNLPVCADVDKLRERLGNLADDCNIADIGYLLVNVADDDGFTTLNKDGSERLRRCLVIS